MSDKQEEPNLARMSHFLGEESRNLQHAQ